MISRTALLGLVAINLAGCAAMERLDHIGEPPTLTPVGGGVRTDRQVSLPMPRPEPVVYQSNSLWAAGSRSFFKDQRATKIGDIVTVQISMDEKAELSNQTARSRKANETADMTNLLGLEQGLAGQLLPGGYDPSTAIGVGSDSSTQGSGSVNRKEKIELTVAAVVTDVLPNGNLVIQGRQEVRVNFELREVVISGIVRPEDIGSDNTIPSAKIA